jgi:hypothetical protein
MRLTSLLSVSLTAGIAFLACTPAKNTVRYNQRSGNACLAAKDDDSKSKSKKDKSSDDEDGAWSDEFDLQGEDLWADVKVVLTQKCVACHAGYDTYDTAKSKIDVYITRMELSPGGVGFMPQGGSKTDADVALLKSWKDAGTPQSGSGGDDEEDANDEDDQDDDDQSDLDDEDDESDDEDSDEDDKDDGNKC